ncbi:DUF418 domain-containing protein [Carboxylicivirga sp. M1479]|uniref:DUF418 domain-containing protein n=1 Tax=Carboxylicivirga sp. M1479 TaxID=2594476 RepID=UPI0011783E15|nr:DUF418 domain-containing protein [Carboxylicivirga sp. M1479]TRX66053.1 DUF418 domain-containing protein [Carboxylicivirga sp. M1479]
MTKQTSNSGPNTNRIVLLDIVRGFALIGILYANSLSWSGIKFVPFEIIKSFGNVSVDTEIYSYLKFFVDTKFYTIFSLLFGIGFSLQISRNKDNPKFPALYARRLTWLLIIGIAHSLIWSGDILTLYAILGFFMLALKNISVQNSLKLGIALYFTPLLIDIVHVLAFKQEVSTVVKTALKVYPDLSPNEVVAGFTSMDFWTVFKTNFHNVQWRWYDFIPSGRPFKVLGLFLIGSYLYASGYFTTTIYKTKVLISLILTGLVFTGLAMKIPGSISSFANSWTDWFHKLVHEVGQLSMALSYFSILAFLVKRFSNFFLWNFLKAYGQMSLSSYIGHTLLSIFIFYPIIGFGLFGKLSLENVYYVATGILLIQLLFSMLWFSWFKFGPIEWAWRCLTYKKYFPLRKQD